VTIAQGRLLPNIQAVLLPKKSQAGAEPLIEQVMIGYNCTVFAYGQTGTGKPFTMEGGEMRNEGGISWDSDSTSGIIPRALAQMFDILQRIFWSTVREFLP